MNPNDLWWSIQALIIGTPIEVPYSYKVFLPSYRSCMYVICDQKIGGEHSTNIHQTVQPHLSTLSRVIFVHGWLILSVTIQFSEIANTFTVWVYLY